jgi:hypothetical protein
MATPKDYDGKTELFSISFRINGFTIRTFKVMKTKTNKKGAFDHLSINVNIVSYESMIEASNEKTGFLNELSNSFPAIAVIMNERN